MRDGGGGCSQEQQQQQHEEPAASFLQTWWGYLFGGSSSSSSQSSAARPSTATTKNRGTLSIRYEYRGKLYEIGLPLLDHGTKVVLPHPHATELGPAERVH